MQCCCGCVEDANAAGQMKDKFFSGSPIISKPDNTKRSWGRKLKGVPSAAINSSNSRRRGRQRLNEMDSSDSDSDWDAAPKQTVSSILAKISGEQVPKPEFKQKCQDIALLVISVLEKEMGSSCAGHVMVSGSFGKGTAIMNDSDYDIVVFFNETEPPFTKILNCMESAIKDNADRLTGFKWKFRSSIHICFEVQGMQFDIAPAAQFDDQFTWQRWCRFTPSLLTAYPTEQYQQTMKRIRNLKEPEKYSYLYSSSLAVDAVTFVQRQCPFIHSVIRLAKFWARHVNTNINRIQIRGRSLLMETIAIHACYSLGPAFEMTDGNLDKAFMKFLEFLADGMQLRLYVFVNYVREDIPDGIFNQTPLVLDPVNPYNNLLSPTNFSQTAVKCFQDAAKGTIQNIKGWARGERDNEIELRNIVAMCNISSDKK